MGTVDKLLKIANVELGVKEAPSGSNKVKYAEWYGMNGYAWCVMFVMWVFNQAGVSLPVKTASCTVLMNYAKKAGMWVTSGYQPGDVVIYDWGGDRSPDHCGIVESVDWSSVVAIEGNTTVGNDSDGGEVMRRVRQVSQILGAVRPVYEEEVMDVKKLSDDDIVYIVTRYNEIVKNKPVGSVLKSDFEAAKKAGITDGSSPQGIPTRAQVAAMVYRGTKEK